MDIEVIEKSGFNYRLKNDDKELVWIHVEYADREKAIDSLIEILRRMENYEL